MKKNIRICKLLVLILSLVIISLLVCALCFKNKKMNSDENNKSKINNTYESIKDKIIMYKDNSNIYITKENDKKEFYIINKNNEVLLKADYIEIIYNNVNYLKPSLQYSVIIGDEFKVYELSDDSLKELELDDNIYEELIKNGVLIAVDIDSNYLFDYKSNDIKGEQLVFVFELCINDYDNIENTYYKDPILFIIDKNTNKVQKLNPDLLNIKINYDYDNYSPIVLNSLSNYTIDIINSKIKNSKTNKEYNIMPFVDEKNNNMKDLYVVIDLYDDSYKGIYNPKESYIIEPLYSFVSCSYDYLLQPSPCINSYTTLINFEKLISLKSGKVLIDTIRTNELSNGKFIGFKNNKDILYTSEGKELLKGEYIGYNKDLGYIVIDNKNVKIYDENINEKELPIFDDLIYLSSDINTVTKVLQVDINNNDYFIYNDNEYTGKKTVIISGCKVETPIYIILNNRIVKLNDTLLKKNEDLHICN